MQADNGQVRRPLQVQACCVAAAGAWHGWQDSTGQPEGGACWCQLPGTDSCAGTDPSWGAAPPCTAPPSPSGCLLHVLPCCGCSSCPRCTAGTCSGRQCASLAGICASPAGTQPLQSSVQHAPSRWPCLVQDAVDLTLYRLVQEQEAMPLLASMTGGPALWLELLCGRCREHQCLLPWAERCRGARETMFLGCSHSRQDVACMLHQLI